MRRSSTACLVLAVALGVGCDEVEGDDPAQGGDSVAGPARDLICSQKEARELLNASRSCSGDQDCALFALGGRCAPLTCYEAFNAQTDIAALDREIDRLVTGGCCSVGAISCAGRDSVRAVCDLQTQRCRAEAASSQADAGL